MLLPQIKFFRADLDRDVEKLGKHFLRLDGNTSESIKNFSATRQTFKA